MFIRARKSFVLYLNLFSRDYSIRFAILFERRKEMNKEKINKNIENIHCCFRCYKLFFGPCMNFKLYFLLYRYMTIFQHRDMILLEILDNYKHLFK